MSPKSQKHNYYSIIINIIFVYITEFLHFINLFFLFILLNILFNLLALIFKIFDWKLPIFWINNVLLIIFLSLLINKLITIININYWNFNIMSLYYPYCISISQTIYTLPSYILFYLIQQDEFICRWMLADCWSLPCNSTLNVAGLQIRRFILLRFSLTFKFC